MKGFASLSVVTSDVAAALEDADVLMVVTPATAHRNIAEMIAPHLKDGQIVVLNPGRTGGALEVAKVIQSLNPSVRPYIAEAQTLLYAARLTNPGQVHIYGVKNSVPLATLPAYEIGDVLPVIRKVLPQFVPGDNVLKTSLDNIGAVFHPAITILNAARIEDTHGDFEYYVEGVTPAVAQVLEAIDGERVAVASALGIRAHTAREWLYLAYDAAGKTLHDAMRANPGYAGIKATATMQHRYITEDVPASLVPIASIGKMLGVPTPTIRAMIQLASVMHGVDYWAEGRTVDRLGIKGMKIRPTRADVFGLVRPAVEAHTLGISSVEQILRDCGYRTVTAGAQACAAFGRPEEPSSISEIEGWIRSHRITILGFSYRLDPEDGAALFGRLARQMKARRLLSEQGGASPRSVFCRSAPDMRTGQEPEPGCGRGFSRRRDGGGDTGDPGDRSEPAAACACGGHGI